MAMAFQGGFLNVAGYLSCHRFVSHMTGAWTLSGLEFFQQNWSEFGSIILTPVAFLLGCILSGVLVDVRLKQKRQPRYYEVFGLLFMLILAILFVGRAGWFGAFGEPFTQTRDYVLMILLSFVCGLQNGTINSVSRMVVRTSHLTGLTTDLGLGIARLLNRRKMPDPLWEELRSNLLRVGLIFFFVVGAGLGGVLFSVLQFQGFAIPALISGTLFSLMLYFQALKKASA
jgi:uncharacterized membrane protein YoaK (UPF0700 family)